ncbi:Ovule protein [Acinetobacter baumannii]
MYLLHRNSFYFPNRSTLIRLSFPTLDDKKSEYYPLPAGLHCQSTLTGRIANAHEKVSLFCGHPCVPPLRWNGRGTPSGVLIFWLSVCQPSLVSPPLFDSNVVKLLYSQRSSLMRTISSHLLAFAKIFLSIPLK